MGKSSRKPTAESTSPCFPCFPQELYQRMSDDLHLIGKAERTRHSSRQTTMIDLHLTETAEADARKTIEKLFRRP